MTGGHAIRVFCHTLFVSSFCIARALRKEAGHTLQKDETAALALMAKDNEMGLRWMIQRYTPYVSAVVWGIVGGWLSAQDAEEITSDAFLTLWRNRQKLRPGKVKSYLGSIARSRAIDRLRQAGQDVSMEDEELVICSDTPEREVLLRESKELLRRYLMSLKATDREILIRYYYLYESAPAIARRLGMRPDAVRQRLARAREQFRRLFDKEERA